MLSDQGNLFTSLGLPAPEKPLDLEARGSEYLAASIARDRREYWERNTPPEYRHFDPQHPDLLPNKVLIEQVLSWKFGKRGLLLSGPTDVGKSRVMYSLCRRLLCDEHRDVGMWTAQRFFSELSRQEKFGRDEAEDFLKRQSERSILFIDDYGQQALLASREEFAQQHFFGFLDRRRGLGLPLLITTNLSADEIAAERGRLHGDPLITRLLDLAEPIKFRHE